MVLQMQSLNLQLWSEGRLRHFVDVAKQQVTRIVSTLRKRAVLTSTRHWDHLKVLEYTSTSVSVFSPTPNSTWREHASEGCEEWGYQQLYIKTICLERTEETNTYVPGDAQIIRLQARRRYLQHIKVSVGT